MELWTTVASRVPFDKLRERCWLLLARAQACGNSGGRNRTRARSQERSLSLSKGAR